jgi:Bacterial capsule synthesis protein PGA_cap
VTTRPEGPAGPGIALEGIHDDHADVEISPTLHADERRRARRELRRRQIRRRRAVAGAALAVFAAAATALAVAVSGEPAAAGHAAPPSRQTAPKAAVPVATRTLAPVEIAAVGDMTFGMNGVFPPGGADAILHGVTPLLAADFTVGNLETTLGSGRVNSCGADSSNCYRFQAPPSTAGALRRAGFDAVNLANNHANDFGPVGQAQTSAALRAARLPYTGRPGQITVVRAHGVRIALVGFAPYPFAQNMLDIPGAAVLVRIAAARADLVVVLMHAGAEGKSATRVRPGTETFLGENRGNAMRFAHAVVDAGADLVLGSGPHVLRGIEFYRGRPIAYSLGNFSGYKTLNTSGVSGVSAVLRVTLAPDGSFAAGEVVPLVLDANGTPAADPAEAAHGVVRTLSRMDFGRRGAGIDSRGRISAPAA